MKKMKLKSVLFAVLMLGINSAYAFPEVVVENGPEEPPTPIDNIIPIFLMLGIVFAYFILKKKYNSQGN